jgi:ribosomal protein L37AE/L43A
MDMRTQTCPCCSNSLLRHVRQGKLYWFCTSCWQEVPLFAVGQTARAEASAVRERPVSV